MSKTILLPLVALAIGIAWYFLGFHALREIPGNIDLPKSPASLETVRTGIPTAMTPSPERAPSSSRSVSGVRKCQTKTKIIYTDDPCPPGSRERTVDGGTTMVVPATSVSRMPAVKIPNARDVFAQDDGPTLRDKRMEQIIGQ
jgi:hypothetical protein